MGELDAEVLVKRNDSLSVKDISSHLIGGANIASELDAKRAIEQGTRLALSL